MASKYTPVIQKLLNSGLITSTKANEMSTNSRKHNQPNMGNIIRIKKRGLSIFRGNKLRINKTSKNRQNKLKNSFIGNYTHITISGASNQCYARTTLFVLLLYINRSANSLREFLKIVDSDFRFEPLDLPSPIINEQSIKERFSKATNNDFTIYSLGNILSFDDNFIDNTNRKKYEISSIKHRFHKINNKIKRNPLDIVLECKDTSKPYSRLVEITLRDYITDRYKKVSLIERNRTKTQQINQINSVMTRYYNDEKNKELVIETFIQMYNNSKLFNRERENKILRDYIKFWRLKIQIILGTAHEHIISEIDKFFGDNSYVVFIAEFLNNVPFFNSLVFYNYNRDNNKLSITTSDDVSISMNELGRSQLYDINAPVLVGTPVHQEVAVNNKFFAKLNDNKWPKYKVEQNHHNNGGMGKRNEVPKEEFTPNIQRLMNEGSISLEQAHFFMNEKRRRNQRKRNQKLENHLAGEVNSGKMPFETAMTILGNGGAAANRGANRVRSNCRCTLAGGKK